VIIQALANTSSDLPTDASLEASISALKSSISALESSIKTFEGSSGFLEVLAWCCAIAVGIGVAGEVVVIICEYFEDREGWRRGIVRPPGHPSVWRFWFDIVATLLVVAGVFGEAGASMKLASINSQLRSKTSNLRAESDQLLALVTQQAGDANTSANGAAEAVKSAKADVKILNEKTDAVEEQATDLLKKYTEAANALEQEQRKRLALAASLLPRTFPDQSGAAAKLSKSPVPNSVLFKYRDDEESTSMAEQINVILGLLRWKSCRLRESEAGIAPGITCRPALAHPPGSPPYTQDDWRKAFDQMANAGKLCSTVINILQSSGIDAKVGPSTGRIPSGSIEIDVGSKPNSAAEETIRELATPSSNPTLLGSLLMGNSRQAILGGEPPPPTIDKDCNPIAQKK
jgi:hypothetical protein